MNSTDDANDMDGMGGMVNAGATDGVECWETARANHDFSSRHGHALAGMLGPAFVAAVAYVDPGNVAANITSGARYGYLLVWVLVLANCMSVLIQYQSAKTWYRHRKKVFPKSWENDLATAVDSCFSCKRKSLQ